MNFMKHFLFIISLLMPMYLFAQNNNEPYAKEWQKADSLQRKGMPESAAKIAESIYAKAKSKGQQVQMMKAQVFLIGADFERSEDGWKESIERTDSMAHIASFPENAIWQSITAELYWNYYLSNRWQILNRTKLADDVANPDFELWDADRFYKKAGALYLSSIARAKELEQINIGQYSALLTPAVNTATFRPTLFDLLAYRALSYFENDEKDITKPAYAFTINNEKVFAPAEAFIKISFATKDTGSLQKQALEIYQCLLKLHSDDKNKDAYLDADLQRLQFVYNHTTLSKKKERYAAALKQFEEANAENPLAGLAAYRRLELQQQEMYSPYNSGVEQKEPANGLVALRKNLENIMAAYPKSEGAALAQNMLNTLLAKSLQLTTEEVVLPNEPSKILLAYKNVAKVFLRVVRIDENSLGKQNYDEQFKAKLLSLKAVYTNQVSLPGTESLRQHSAEIKINALATGNYAVIISSDESFKTKDNIIQYADFQVSGLSAIQANERGYVLDRKTGEPIAGATVVLYRNHYNYQKQQNNIELIQQLKTADDGHYDLIIAEPEYCFLKLIYKGDTLSSTRYFQRKERNDNTTHHKTFFFTDRSIYRPGQTIYFKGIMLQAEDNGRKNKVIANEKTTVTFYDANDTKIASATLTTNEFGSFTGTFTAPQGVLTGAMSIRNDNGSVYISVEEYKRPKFFAAFDTLKKSFALNDKITVEGKAMAYAGNAVDGAKVKYRVVRDTRFPYWWRAYRWGFPQSASMEIANGEATTDKDGSYKIDFTALPDESVNPDALPVFTYTVTAEVVDLNGETRTAATKVQIGYASLQMVANIPEQITAKDMDKISITTKNLNNVFVPATMHLKISRLQPPPTPLRERLWEMPDQYLMDSITFKQNFPDDVYKNENDKINWPIAETTYKQSFQTTADGMALLSAQALGNAGWYVFEMMIKDKNGKELTEKKYAQVFIANQTSTTEALSIIADKTTLLPEENARLTLLSAYSKLHVVQMVDAANHTTEWNNISLDGKPSLWQKQITEALRGGMTAQYAAVKNNRFYMRQVYLAIPWSNKQLDISWETHRDKLQPDEKEKWTMVVRGEKKEKIAAEMIATLYDASLDALKPHDWSVSGIYPAFYTNKNWIGLSFNQKTGMGIAAINPPHYQSYQREYADLDGNIFLHRHGRLYTRGYDAMAAPNAAAVYKHVLIDDVSDKSTKKTEAISIESARGGATNYIIDGLATNQQSAQGQTATAPPIRKNLQETAFFFPQLRTDEEGNIRMEFTMPEALTEWKLMAIAHTKDMSTGMIEGKVKTQKDLMVMPNLPRFFRQGDELSISTKISNLSDKELTGTATLELLNAATLQPLNTAFRLQQKETNFTVAKGQSKQATWLVHIPESLYEPVVVRITASAGHFTDGEENTLPVITNRMLVTETLPVWMNGNGTKTYSFDKLKSSGSSSSLAQHALTLEYTGNPAWYAVQALPYLMEYPYECAEQTFNRYYANALAAHIINQSPKVKAIFDKWAAASSLASPLAQNEALKSALLEETPWVMQAQNETEQRKNIARLFDTYKLAKELDATMRKLKDMQLSNGAFGWFNGMYADRYTTQYIVTGIGRLQQLGATASQKDMQEIASKALPYLDEEMKRGYDELVRNKAKMDERHISYFDAQYLYMRSFFKQEMPYPDIYNYYQKQAAQYWPSFNPYIKGMLAIALQRKGNKTTAKDIIQSLRETAIHKEETGMYWKRANSYWWYEAPIESQALLMECFKEVANDDNAVDEMKLWLLKNKQTNNWHTTKATADACYALLLTGSDWLAATPEIKIKLGDKSINSNAQKQEAGSGYFKERIAGKDVKPAMGNIALTVSGNESASKQPSWGAVYWQYFEDMDKISAEDKQAGVAISKQLFIEKNTVNGKELTLLKDKGIVGDRVISRIVINVDRDMDYVHLKDMRAACFEPENVLSGYKWNNGIGYYESTKDVSTNFFFDHLRKGKYVFEYPVHISQKGVFSNGIATIQCMYAPEFSNHTNGETITTE